MTVDEWLDEATRAVADSLGLGDLVVDRERLMQLASAAAATGVRPMAPLAAYVWGAACATWPQRSASELSGSLIDTLERTEPVPAGEFEDVTQWRRLVQMACDAVALAPDGIEVERIPQLGREVKRLSVRRMTPVVCFLLGCAQVRTDRPLAQLQTLALEALREAPAVPQA